MRHYQTTTGTSSKVFVPGTTFDDILNLYLFDRELRVLLFDAIERTEVAFRTQLIHQLSCRHGSNWYENNTLFVSRKSFDGDYVRVITDVNRTSEQFVRHYKNTYSSPLFPPAWMALEVATLGLLSRLYKNLKSSPEKKAIAKHFNLHDPILLESWMQTMAYVRNHCAHHSRIWDRTFVISPKLPRNITILQLTARPVYHNKLYPFLCCLAHLRMAINPNTQFRQRVKALLRKYPNTRLQTMGFPANWETEPLWL